jgi:hypothetical protein
VNAVGQKERKTQQRVVRLFREQLGYHHLGDWTGRGNSAPRGRVTGEVGGPDRDGARRSHALQMDVYV